AGGDPGVGRCTAGGYSGDAGGYPGLPADFPKWLCRVAHKRRHLPLQLRALPGFPGAQSAQLTAG
ncbi:hypothetical protein DF186_25990, partial [Enterococcus hirae]